MKLISNFCLLSLCLVLTDRMPWYTEKCWGRGTRLLLHDGTAKSIDAIVYDHRAGIKHQLMGDDGQPRQVLGASHGHTAWDEERWKNYIRRYGMEHSAPPKPSMYQITPNDVTRASFTCNGDHILVLQFHRIATSDSVRVSDDGSSFVVDLLTIVDGEDISTPLEMNSWRNGHVAVQSHTFDSYSAALSCHALASNTSLHWECSVDAFRSCHATVQQMATMYQPGVLEFTPPEVSLQQRINKCTRASDDQIAQDCAFAIGAWIASGASIATSNSITFELLTEISASYQLSSPPFHIPFDLLRESQPIRSAILNGILSVSSSSSLDVNSLRTLTLPSSKPLLDGCIHLSRGLGYAVSSMKESPDVTHLTLSSTVCHRSTGFTVTAIEHDDYYGLVLDGNERCLMGDFIITHNSKYAIYQHVMVEKHLPPIPADANLHPKLVELINACHQFEPAARPGQKLRQDCIYRVHIKCFSCLLILLTHFVFPSLCAPFFRLFKPFPMSFVCSVR